MNIIRRELKASWKSLLVWALASIFLAYAGIIKFDSIIGGGPEVIALLERFPRVVLALFNMLDLDITQLPDYFSIIVNYLMVMMAAQGLFLGLRLFLKEEQDMTAEFLLTKPRSRARIYAQKLAAGLVIVLILQAIILGANYVALKHYLPEHGPMLINYSGAMLVIHGLFLVLGAALASIAPRGKAEQVGLGLILAGYFVPVLTNLSERYYAVGRYFPFNMFLDRSMSSYAGTPYLKLGLLLLLSAVLFGIGCQSYVKRDIYS